MKGLVLKESGECDLVHLDQKNTSRIIYPKLLKPCIHTDNIDQIVSLGYDDFIHISTICLLPPGENYDPSSDLEIFAENGITEVNMAPTDDGTTDGTRLYNGVLADNSYVWGQWTTDTYGDRQKSVTIKWWSQTGSSTINHSVIIPIPSKLTEEQIQQNLDTVAKAKVENDRRRAMQLLAEKRAHELLLDNLDITQKEVFTKKGIIVIKGSAGGIYQIEKSGSICELDKSGKKIKSICIHTEQYLPVDDQILAKKLMFEICEEEARKIGHFSTYIS